MIWTPLRGRTLFHLAPFRILSPAIFHRRGKKSRKSAPAQREHRIGRPSIILKVRLAEAVAHSYFTDIRFVTLVCLLIGFVQREPFHDNNDHSLNTLYIYIWFFAKGRISGLATILMD